MEQTNQNNLLLASSLQISYGINNLPPKVEGLLSQFKFSEIPPVIYLKGKTCSGCFISMMNLSNRSPKKLIMNIEELMYPKGYTSPFNIAVELMKRYISGKIGPYFLALEGGIPKNPLDCYMANYPISYWVKNAARTALGAISIGNCAIYGNPGLANTTSNLYSLKEYLYMEKLFCPVLDIPGCPLNEENIKNTIINLVDAEYPGLNIKNNYDSVKTSPEIHPIHHL
ncbi:MAG: hypothetical protein JXQ65_09225 [Candidatus Marinimicrobia bacterium]|nr:hypothetical protein [Candidatus Neomarinimicrobiota bacterium]